MRILRAIAVTVAMALTASAQDTSSTGAAKPAKTSATKCGGNEAIGGQLPPVVPGVNASPSSVDPWADPIAVTRGVRAAPADIASVDSRLALGVD